MNKEWEWCRNRSGCGKGVGVVLKYKLIKALKFLVDKVNRLKIVSLSVLLRQLTLDVDSEHGIS